jgi:Phage major capsid protein E
MTISLYGTTELVIVQQALPNLPDGFWRNLFPRVITSDREEIMFEQLDLDDRKLAPFVAPNVQGRVMRGQGYSARSFKPAYTKPKHVVDPTKAMARSFGEPLLGGRSLQQRFDAHVANNLRLEREAIERRWDWMACRAVADGMVTVVGEDYPSKTVDFLRDPSLTVTLLTTARWDQLTTADPLADLQSASDDSFVLGNAPITDIVFGTSAWGSFIKNEAVLDLLDVTKRGSTSDFSRTGLNSNTNFQSMGFIDGGQGRFNLWRYSNWYSAVDEATGSLSKTQFLDPRDVVGYGPGIQGAACFGAILDADAGFVAEASIFPKMWKENDPSVVYTMSQSAPLYVPGNPNNTFRIRVQD